MSHALRKITLAMFLLISVVSLASQPIGAQSVGTTGAVNPNAQAGGRTLTIGSNIVFRETITTTASGSVQAIFVDKTTLNIGPNSNLLIDEFVYNPSAKIGKMAVTLTKGVLRVVGGDVTHSDSATVKTPVATIGVRGGILTVSHSPQTGTRVINVFGVVTVTSNANTAQSVTIMRPGFGTTVGTAQAGPTTPVKVDASTIQVAVQSTTSQTGQTGGSTRQPTAAGAIASGLGTSNAALMPTTTQSVQSSAAAPVIAQLVSNASQSATTTGVAAPPAPRFFALQTGGVPYIPSDYIYGAFHLSQLYGYRRGGSDPTTGNDRFGSATLQAGLSIVGTGASQRSTFFVMTGGFRGLSPTDQFHDAGFVATTKFAAANTAMGRASGNADSLAGSEALDGDRVPVGVTLTNDNRISATGTTQTQDSFFFRGNGTPSEFYRWSSQFTQSGLAADTGQERSAVSLTGFIGGIARTYHAPSEAAGTDTAVGRSYVVTGGIVLQFDADRSRMQANGGLTKVTNPNGNTFEFVSANLQAGSLSAPRSRGTYIDDARFAAREAVSNPADSPTDAQISSTNGQILTRSRQAMAVSNLFDGNTVVTELAAGATPCVCEFTRWGAWSMDNARVNSDGTEERDRMHLGWWVAGRPSDPAQIPFVGSATYSGHVIGSVKNSVSNTEYVSAGSLQYNANFANPNASTMSVNNFDGVNYGGAVGFNRTTNTIGGSMPRTGGAALTSAAMDVNGAFFQGRTDPVRDVAGNFIVRANPVGTPAGTNYNYIAGGVFAGSR